MRRLVTSLALLALSAAPAAAQDVPLEGLARVGEIFSGIWNHQLIHADDIQISVGKVLIGLVGLAVAMLLARTLSGMTSRALQRRFARETGHAYAIEKGVYYALAVLLVLTTLNWLSIPLTVFAFLGGAVAIGVGFGTQTLMNNFISGLILLLERGIRVGDLIDVDGNIGRVTKLGSRCSQIRKGDGVDVLVPNSMFVEKNVINWTLSDSTHRFDFTVGLAYGTKPTTALQILQEVLDQHPELLKDPAPAVYFESFGDSALIFHLFYWLSIDKSNGLKVGSELLTRIDAVCREAHIDIPFPQRDITLKSPLAVRLETATPN